MFLPPRSTGRIQQRLAQGRLAGLDSAFQATGSIQFVGSERVEHVIAVGEVLTDVVADELIGGRVTRRRKNLVSDIDAELVASSLSRGVTPEATVES